MIRLLFGMFLALAAGWGLRQAWRGRGDGFADTCLSGTRRDPVGMAIQTPLFLLAAGFAWQGGALSRVLFAPAPWVLGLVLGHVIFAGSLLITHGHPRDVAEVLFGPARVIRYAVKQLDLTLRIFAVAFTEELIFREAAQHAVLIPLLGAVPGILIAAACFVAVHEHLFRNTPRGLAEFAGFALLLGVLYHALDSLALVTAVHAVRNLESSWLEAESGTAAPLEGARSDRGDVPLGACNGFG